MAEKMTPSGGTGQQRTMMFEDMLTYQCQQCQKELTWSSTISSKVKGIGYQATCCGVQYEAHTHMVIMKVNDDRKLNSFPMCKCGHLEHDRDRGCQNENEQNEVCMCWLFRPPR